MVQFTTESDFNPCNPVDCISNKWMIAIFSCNLFMQFTQYYVMVVKAITIFCLINQTNHWFLLPTSGANLSSHLCVLHIRIMAALNLQPSLKGIHFIISFCYIIITYNTYFVNKYHTFIDKILYNSFCFSWNNFYFLYGQWEWKLVLIITVFYYAITVRTHHEVLSPQKKHAHVMWACI